MKVKIEKVAVLGAGVMGSQIAAHLSNAGIPSLLFDMTQAMAERGLKNALELKPSPFYNPKTANLITPCNYDEHLDKIGEADWIIEAIAERLDFKRALFELIEPHLTPNAVVSSNTSGLSIKDMTATLSESFKRRFLVTHFFNPPRYMKLLELVRGENTDDDVYETIGDFAADVLGKGIVHAKDTPNFIANRIGIYGMMLAMKLMEKMHLTVEEVDNLTGTIIGRPKSATFRTADLVGLDILAHVVNTCYEKLPEDEERDIFQIPGYLKKMIENGWLGQKSGKGFYQKVGKDILSIDFNTMEYTPRKKVRFDGYRVAKGMATTPEKIAALAYSDDVAGNFTWAMLSDILIYSANRIPEISDDIVNVDNAMRWGFGWELGPFETWDALGVETSVKRMEREGKEVTSWVKQMLQAGYKSFYELRKGKRLFYSVADSKMGEIEEKPQTVNLALEKSRGKSLKRNWSASLIDIGDGVVCVEFHSPLQPAMNPIDGAIIDMLNQALDMVSDGDYRGLIIGHQGTHFSAGANLAMILQLCENKDWKRLEEVSRYFQDTGQRLKFAPFPVVAAPHNLCLGGGFEIIGACDRIVASAELYCGAVEVGVGLIPGAGGNLRLLLNFIDSMAPARPGPFPPVQRAFETIGFAKVSSSAKEAVKLGYLKKGDKIVINSDNLLFSAKQAVINLSSDYTPPEYRADIILPGEGGRLAVEAVLDNMVLAGRISEHDRLIGKKLAYVLTGGDRASPTNPVDEQYILDIEREAFVSLAAEPLSQARMAHMLKTGKPLRN